MAEIRCPMCGKPNPADQNVCQYCEARLKPLTDELSRSQPPIHPGEEPTDRDTGQLESILPQWLREIRQQARESADEEAGQPPAEDEARHQDDRADLLAGLQSQSGGDEEVPDWLSGLRSEGGQVDFEEASAEEDLGALKSMLGEDTPVSQEEEAGGLPDWLAGLDANETDQSEERSAFFEAGGTEQSVQSEGEIPASSSGIGWEADFETESGPQAESAQDEPTFEVELPAWLQDSGQPPQDETEIGLPAWLDREKAEPSPQGEEETPSGEGDLQGWLASLGEETTGEGSPQETGQPAAEGEIPDWLSSLVEEKTEEASPAETEGETADLPGWLAALGEESGETAPEESSQLPGETERPGWLSSLKEESLSEEEKEAPTDEVFTEPSQMATEGAIPDWLARMGEASEEAEQPAQETESTSFTSDVEAEEAAGMPAFVDDEGQPIATEDVDAIFSMDMPDWLSDAEKPVEREVTPDEGEPPGEGLRPAELPSWVQAMRPVESVLSETTGPLAEEQPVEERGPLAGLRGVLPAVPGVGPSSKPKAYSIKLLASEDQLSNATLLENMLVQEVEPKPVATQKVVLTQRILRWLIATVLLLVVAGTVYYGTQINTIPNRVPPETSAVLSYLNNSLPANAPVLLVFDYEAARAGEMEAAAAPVVDQMLTLKSPRLSLVSSTPVGSGLAERFMQILQGDRQYVRNENFINLGYLPGGAAGVQAFSSDPVTTKQLTTTGEGAWTTPVLQGVGQLSDFATIILLTDEVETARIWIEQTQGDLGEARLLVVSSAQSGPMIRPYVRSGQVDGMVTGLEGSAPIEAANSGRPGMARRYWDAFGFGLLAAVLMIALGSLWSMVSSFQTLRKEQGEG